MPRYEITYLSEIGGTRKIRVIAADLADAYAFALERRPMKHEVDVVTQLPDAEPYVWTQRRKLENTQ